MLGLGGPVGEIANLAWNCFLNVATRLRSVSKVTVCVRAPPSLHDVQMYRDVEPEACGSGMLTEWLDPSKTTFCAGLGFVVPSFWPLSPARFVVASRVV